MVLKQIQTFGRPLYLTFPMDLTELSTYTLKLPVSQIEFYLKIVQRLSISIDMNEELYFIANALTSNEEEVGLVLGEKVLYIVYLSMVCEDPEVLRMIAYQDICGLDYDIRPYSLEPLQNKGSIIINFKNASLPSVQFREIPSEDMQMMIDILNDQIYIHCLVE